METSVQKNPKTYKSNKLYESPDLKLMTNSIGSFGLLKIILGSIGVLRVLCIISISVLLVKPSWTFFCDISWWWNSEWVIVFREHKCQWSKKAATLLRRWNVKAYSLLHTYMYVWCWSITFKVCHYSTFLDFLLVSTR